MQDLVAAGDTTAFRELYNRWHDKVNSLCMYLTGSDYISEEITQEVFVKVWNHRHQLPQIQYFPSWIRTIARNTIINELKSRTIERLALQTYTAAKDHHSDETNTTLFDRDFARLVQEALDGMTDKQKQVWLLTRESGLTLEHVARQMGISRSTVKGHLARATEIIRAKLKGHIELILAAVISLFLKP